MNSVNLIPGTEHMLNKVDGWTGLQKGIKCVPVCRVCSFTWNMDPVRAYNCFVAGV